MNCWEILELERATADEKSVKASYARLLKLTRPDRDPAGFQRLKQAFEEARFELKYKTTRPDFDAVDLSASVILPEPLRQAPVIILPVPDAIATTELQARKQAFAAALEKGVPEEMREASQRWSELPQSDPDCIKAWAIGTLDLANRFGEQIFLSVQYNTLLLELEHNHSALTLRILEIRINDCDTPFLSWLGKAIINKGQSMESNATTGVALQLATFLAISDPVTSRELLDYCFPRLRGVETYGLGNIEFLQASVPILVGVLSGKAMQFIGNVLADPGRTQDWTSEAGKEAHRQLNSRGYKGWRGFELLRQVPGDSTLAEIIRKFDARPSTPITRPEPVQSGSGFHWWYIPLIIFVLRGLGGLLNTTPAPPVRNYSDWLPKVTPTPIVLSSPWPTPESRPRTTPELRPFGAGFENYPEVREDLGKPMSFEKGGANDRLLSVRPSPSPRRANATPQFGR